MTVLFGTEYWHLGRGGVSKVLIFMHQPTPLSQSKKQPSGPLQWEGGTGGNQHKLLYEHWHIFFAKIPSDRIKIQ